MSNQLLSINSYHYRRGGADIVYLDHAALFEEQGWSNTFFSMHHPKNLATPDSRYFARTVDYECAEGALDSARMALATIYNPDARRSLRSLLAQKRFDIAHVHNVYHHLTPAIFDDLSNARIPIVMTAHDLKVACPAVRMFNSKGVCEACKGGNLSHVVRNRCIKDSAAMSAVVMAESYLYRARSIYAERLSCLVTPSRFYRDKIVEWGFPADKVVHVPNFVQPIEASFAGGYDAPLLYFGRLSAEKGLLTLVRAAAISRVPVEIAGTGPLEGELRCLIDKLCAPVRLLGRLDGDALWSRVGQARAIVLPSEWYENGPLSVIEAYLLRRPVIGADIGGIPEVIDTDHGSAGWLFRSADADDLAHRLREVAACSSAELAAKGSVGEALANDRFTKERYFSELSRIYERSREGISSARFPCD